MTTAHYLPAPEILAGDILPDISRFPVATITVFPHESTRVTFSGTTFTRWFSYGGPDFGWETVRIERA